MVRAAELSSLVSSLEELSRRVTALAEEAQTSRDEEMATELFAVERSMTAALRRLRRVAVV
jgi:hypothetical protein